MAENVKVCEINASLKEKIKKFRFRKATNNAGIVMKIDKESQEIILDEEYEDYSPEEVAEELPTSQPRFVLYSYKLDHSDGRVSYPLCFIFVSPVGCKPEMQMMYAGSLKALVQDAGLTKVFDVRSPDDLTEEWLKEKLSLFR